MNNSSLSQRPGDAGPRAGLARLVRQACLLREQGDAAGAARLQENELATAVRDLRLAHGPEFLPESELQAMFAAEERRVADAVILSELLISQLVGYLPTTPGPARTSPVRVTPERLPAALKAAAGPPAIPELLDAMLAAERPGRRLASANQRES